MRGKATVSVLSVVGMILLGCGGGGGGGVVTEGPSEPVRQQPGVHPTMVGLPAWCIKGGAAFPEDKGKAIYGVGVLSGVKNPANAMIAGEQRARRAIGRVLDQFVAEVTKDYMKSVLADGMSTAEEGQVIENVGQNITKANAAGIEIVDKYYDQASNTWYMLGKLEMNNVATQLATELKDAAKARKLKMEANEAHEELQRIIGDAAADMY